MNAMLSKATPITLGLGLSAVIGALWFQSREHTRDEFFQTAISEVRIRLTLIEQKLGVPDRWTGSDMREYAAQLKIRNPQMDIPEPIHRDRN